MNSAAGASRRRYDPDRRERITEAAIRVVAEAGIEGLTHRAVAERAGVPLGSTSYHFADKDDLLNSAVELAEAVNRDVLAAILSAHSPDTDLPGAMAGLVEELTIRQREQLILDYELYLAARRRPFLRDASRRWITDIKGMIRRYAPDEATVTSMSYLFEGLLVQAIVLDKRLPAAETVEIFRRAMTP